MLIQSNKLGELRHAVRQELTPLYEGEELLAIERELFSFLTGLSPSRMVLERDRMLDESMLFRLQKLVRRLKMHEPLQYVTGRAFFRGMEFMVDKRVLVPRPETEELVGWVMEAGLGQGGRLLDIGTGSGCIAISLKKEMPEADVDAVDISQEALAVASQNAASIGVDVNFMQLDILLPVSRHSLPAYNIIVSNPPYVTPADKAQMRPNVTEYEPRQALFVDGDDPLLFYREIMNFATTNLLPGGSVFFECNEGNAAEVAEMLSKSGFINVELRRDMQGRDRMVKASC